MSKIVVINAEHGGDDIGNKGKDISEKDYVLQISNYINETLKKEGVQTYMVRTKDIDIPIDERVDIIEEETPNTSDTIVITNSIGNTYGGAEVIYSLKNNERLANFISNELESIGVKVNKYYQRRLPSDTTKDYHQIIRDLGNREAIIIEYGDLSYDEDFIKNKWEDLGQAVVNALNKYLGLIDVYYEVKKGDSLYSIAQQFNTTVDALKELNNLGSNNLSVGQQLLIPEINNSNDYYVVKSGDTLYSIAKKNNTTVDELIDLNDLNSLNLSIGQKLKIPKISSNDIDDSYYIVKSGDTLYGIAQKYQTTVSELQNINNLKSNLLTIGQKILIPSDNNVYIVKKGDSLYSIARKYNMTVDELIDLNDLDNTLLSIGQRLKIS